MNRILPAMFAVILCALVAATPAAAETGNSAPVRDLDDGGFVIPQITGPEAPEEYPFRVSLGEEQELVQLTATEVGVEYRSGVMAFILRAAPMHDAEGAAVPVTLAYTGEDVITESVHYRDGNPAAGFAAFRYPIVDGSGWEGGFRTSTVEMNDPQQPATEPPAGPVSFAPTCTVPYLRGFGLVAVKKLLRDADCRIGRVRLARGATKVGSHVVKQFRAPGTQLPDGAPVAVRLGAR
ncbi:MAG: hypothetical protein JST59_12215 [Actinobacteria bacterium]|nr:hypothetical protein [Actinomycetota bacterium]